MVTINEIIALAERAKNSGINRIYCHHTGGLYKMNSVEKEHYHICIESDGTVRINGELTDYKEHTWHRNSNAIGIALCCAYGATVYKNPERINWNGYPPTPIQVERLAEVICFIATVLEIPIDSEHVMTHAEIADIDGYGLYSNDPDLRWDLLLLDDPGTGRKDQPGGDVIRGLAIWKQNN